MNKTELSKRMVRHGDLLCVPVVELPPNLEQIYSGDRYSIVSSDSGHDHVLVGDVTVFKDAETGRSYFRVNKESRVEHAKSFDAHDTKQLLEGIYSANIKTELDIFSDLRRQVID